MLRRGARRTAIGALARSALPALLVAGALAAPAARADDGDPLLDEQWGLSGPADIDVEGAWQRTDGAGVVVAVLDTGLQVDHPDLAGAVWTNPGEVPDNSRDDDGDGIVDDVHGANMFDDSSNVADDNGHGTHVAGIVAARRGNGIGGSGVAPGARIMPVKVLDASMSGSTDTLARGIRYAVDRGARILNVSINTDEPTDEVASAVRYAGERGAVVVASAGNDRRDIDVVGSYPASLADTAVIGVAAESRNGRLWSGSNSGLQAVDVTAPGDRILSTVSGSGYQTRTGTSAAAPFVAGSLALLAAARPDLPHGTLAGAIVDTARRSHALSALVAGGRIDAGAAMRRVVDGVPGPGGAPAPPAERPRLRLRGPRKARAGTWVRVRWRASAADSVLTWRVSLDGRTLATLPAGRMRLSRRVMRSGRHRWRVTGLDLRGAQVVTGRKTFRIVRRE